MKYQNLRSHYYLRQPPRIGLAWSVLMQQQAKSQCAQTHDPCWVPVSEKRRCKKAIYQMLHAKFERLNPIEPSCINMTVI